MKVYKFGGMSVKDAQSIKKLPEIITKTCNDDLIIVVSAMGKTTNALENIISKAFAGENHNDEIENLRQFHATNMLHLCAEVSPDLIHLFDAFTNAVNINEKDNYDKFYDSIVGYGELFSSTIVFHFLAQCGFDVRWLNAMDVIVSDDNWRSGNINFQETEKRMHKFFATSHKKVVITQGFIAGQHNNGTDFLHDIDDNIAQHKFSGMVTLGREGSDYSAAVFAACTGADEITFWKDVDGIFTADPKFFNNAQKLEMVGYDEMVELSYFGAKVLHKKTLSVLNNKNIITKVRSFEDLSKQGTLLVKNTDIKYPPIHIYLDKQVLITLENKAKTIIKQADITYLYETAEKWKSDINIIQISAIKISFCITYNQFSFHDMYSDLQKHFSVKYNMNTLLETIRHYTTHDVANVSAKENVLLTQRTRSVMQIVTKQP